MPVHTSTTMKKLYAVEVIAIAYIYAESPAQAEEVVKNSPSAAMAQALPHAILEADLVSKIDQVPPERRYDRPICSEKKMVIELL